MKKIITISIAVILASIAVAQTELPNMNFEDWHENHYSTWFPNNFYWEPNTDGNWNIWETGNSASTTVNVFPTERTEDAESGNYAVRMETKSVFGQPAAGNIFTGHFIADMFDSQALFGVPFTGTPDAFRGWYKFTPGTIDGNPDTCAIYAILSKWNGTQRVEIAKAELYTYQTVSSYTSFDLPFVYLSTDVPDTISIVLTSSKHGDEFIGGTGSTLFADDLSLYYDNSIVEDATNKMDVKIFFNSYSQSIRIQRNTNASAHIDLYDITGKKIFTAAVYSNFAEIKLPNLHSGVYICAYSSKFETTTQKIMIK